MLLFQSTPSHCLEDYIVWHSNAQPNMGPLDMSWQQIGRAGSLFDNIYPQEFPTFESERRLCGRFWPHYDFYLFESHSPGTDVYIRRSWALPGNRFVHYHVDGGVHDIWSGMSLTILGVVYHLEWAERQAPLVRQLILRAIPDAPPHSRL